VAIKDTKLWTWHVLAGLIIFVLLGLHMLTMHLNELLPIAMLNPAGGHPIDWANVIARAQQISTMVVYILLLGTALYHGLYGLRSILLELNPSQGLRGLISGTIVFVGVVLFVFGTWAAIAARSTALGA
jgi:succinate dehydrogenase / fumarate reductase membrane anchor subunit